MTKETREANNEIILSGEDKIKDKIAGLREIVEQTKVDSDEDLSNVAGKIKTIKEIGKFIRAEMEKYTKPARMIIKNAQTKFLPYEKECDEAEEILKRKAGEYMDKVEAERQRKEKIIADKLVAGRIKDDTAIRKLDELGEVKKTIQGDGATIQRRTVRVAVIINSELIPDEYWIIDEIKVKKVALAGVEIPGVEIREESQITIK